MSLKFWLGGAASDKSRRLNEYILKDAAEHPDRQYLVIVPEQFGLQTQRELVLGSENHGILNIDVLSFTRFAHRISDEVGAYAADVTMLDDVGKSLLIGMIANEHKKELTVFGGDLDKPGYIDRIKSIISEFMQYGITPEKAAEMSENAAKAGRGMLAGKLGDVALLYKQFKDYIQNRYTTVEETLDLVSSLIPASDTVKNSVIAFDGYTGFTPVQNKLLGVLMEYAKEVHVALLLEDCIQENDTKDKIQEHELFYLSKKTMNTLGRMADERHVIIEDSYNADKHAINNIRNSKSDIVYSKTDKSSKLNNTHEISTHIFAGNDPNEEIGMVFTRIVDLVRTHGYRYKDIAILTGDIDGYRHPIEREFTKHDIPFFIDKTEPVLMNPFIEYIRAFLDITADNYSQTAVFRFLKSGLAGFEPEEIFMLENYCLAANIKGRKAWHESFKLKTQAVGVEELLVLNNIRERFIAKCDVFTETLSSKPVNAGSKFTVRQFSTALYIVIQADGIEDKLEDASDSFEDAGERKLAAEYDKIYLKIMHVLEQLCDLIPDEKVDIRGFVNLLDAGLDAIRIGIIPTGMDYVQVADLTRSRIPDVKALFIIGANDGVIPLVASSGGIINENEREFLTQNDADLTLAPTVKEDIFTQQLYIYMAINKPTEHLFVSYSRLSVSGKSILPSYIVKKILNSHPHLAVEKRPEIPEYYTDEEEAFEDLTVMLRPMIAGTLPGEGCDRVKTLTKYFLSRDKYASKLTKLLEKEILRSGADMDDSIGSALAHAIYGKKINASITRLENYAKCAYAYFLKYGLSLKEREVFSFEARDMGNIFHDSMKEYAQLIQKKGFDWKNIPDDKRDALMDEAVEHVMKAYRDSKLSSSARNAYMENRIRRIMRRSAAVVCEQIKKGDFTPRYFEVDFDTIKGEDTLSLELSDGDMMRLYGRIDRIDTCESDDGIYIRVIDYKSSRHDIDLLAVYEGRQLQLLVYLNAARQIVNDKMQKEDEDKPVIPAGVLYYRMDDPMVPDKEGLAEADIEKLIMKNLCLKGLVNEDVSVVKLMDSDIESGSTILPVSLTKKGELRKSKSAISSDEFDILSAYVTSCMIKMGDEILSGNIAIPEPGINGRFTGPDCGFCPYKTICNGKAGSRKNTEDAADIADDGDAADADNKTANSEKAGKDELMKLMNGKDEDETD